MGVASIRFDKNGIMYFTKRLFRPQEIKVEKDKKGVSLICCPEKLAGKQVVLKVDNLGGYYGW